MAGRVPPSLFSAAAWLPSKVTQAGEVKPGIDVPFVEASALLAEVVDSPPPSGLAREENLPW